MASPTQTTCPATEVAAEDEAKSEQPRQQQTTDEQKGKKRRTEEDRDLGPIAQSTPLVPGPSRATLQAKLSAIVTQTHLQQHSPPPPTMAPSPILGHYFPFGPASVEPVSMFPSPMLYNPWLRWTSAAAAGSLVDGGIGIPPHPSRLFGMQMEPIEMMNERTNGSSTPSMRNVANLFAAIEQRNGRKDDDSGMGSDDTSTTTSTTTHLFTPTSAKNGDKNGTTNTNLEQSSSSSSAVVVVVGSSTPSSNGHQQSLSPLIVPPQPIAAAFTDHPIDHQHQQQQQLNLAHPTINSYETYCTVPGRLTLLSNQKKYRVSVGEIQRRLAPPECMNASVLGGILRKAKNKDGGRLLREQLHMYGVELTMGRRKQSALSCFSSLVEQEAVQLAMDFRTICQRDYPTEAVATHSLTADISNAHEAYIRRMELFYASKLLNRILELHKADQSPTTITEQPKCEPAEQIGAVLSPEVQTGLAHFSLMTHGFGSLSMQAVLETLIRVISEGNAVLNRHFQSPLAATGQQSVALPMANGRP